MVKVYLASPFFDDEQVDRVKRVEQALLSNPTVTEFFSPRLNQLEHLPYGTKEWAEAVYLNDIKHIDWADVIVAVHDFTSEGATELHGEPHYHVDSGTAFELGYAIGTRKPFVLVHELGGIVNLMLSQSMQAYFEKAEDVAGYDFNKMPKIEYTGDVM